MSSGRPTLSRIDWSALRIGFRFAPANSPPGVNCTGGSFAFEVPRSSSPILAASKDASSSSKRTICRPSSTPHSPTSDSNSSSGDSNAPDFSE